MAQLKPVKACLPRLQGFRDPTTECPATPGSGQAARIGLKPLLISPATEGQALMGWQSPTHPLGSHWLEIPWMPGCPSQASPGGCVCPIWSPHHAHCPLHRCSGGSGGGLSGWSRGLPRHQGSPETPGSSAPHSAPAFQAKAGSWTTSTCLGLQSTTWHLPEDDTRDHDPQDPVAPPQG